MKNRMTVWSALILLVFPTCVFASLTDIGGSDPNLGFSGVIRIDDDMDRIWRLNAGTELHVSMIDKNAYYEQRLSISTENFSEDIGSQPLLIDTAGGTSGLYQVDRDIRFVWMLDPYSTNPDEVQPGIWSSVPAWNSDGMDHMVTYRLIDTDTYYLGWEDLPKGGIPGKFVEDIDYNDLIFEITGASPVPIPTTLLLLSSGLIGMISFRRHQQSKLKVKIKSKEKKN